MNDWETHQVEFQPSEGLSKNETSIRVLDNDVKDTEERQNRIEERIDKLESAFTDGELLHIRNDMTDKIKEDNGYKFLLQVSAFSKLKMNHVMNELTIRRVGEPQQDMACSGSCNAPAHDRADKKWLNVPEITGVVQLSPTVYGHIKEAEMIVRNRLSFVDLKTLVEDPLYQTPFARLVGIRIILSGVLTGLGNRRDRSFQRLHQEQHMILKQLDRIPRKISRDWTKPLDVEWKQ